MAKSSSALTGGTSTLGRASSWTTTSGRRSPPNISGPALYPPVALLAMAYPLLNFFGQPPYYPQFDQPRGINPLRGRFSSFPRYSGSDIDPGTISSDGYQEAEAIIRSLLFRSRRGSLTRKVVEAIVSIYNGHTECPKDRIYLEPKLKADGVLENIFARLEHSKDVMQEARDRERVLKLAYEAAGLREDQGYEKLRRGDQLLHIISKMYEIRESWIWYELVKGDSSEGVLDIEEKGKDFGDAWIFTCVDELLYEAGQRLDNNHQATCIIGAATRDEGEELNDLDGGCCGHAHEHPKHTEVEEEVPELVSVEAQGSVSKGKDKKIATDSHES